MSDVDEDKMSSRLVEQDTYIFIDVSNIRSACLKTLGFMIDFARLIDYFRRKYPNLKETRYYEGIASGDEKKRRMFKFLARRGYTICSLERKSYNSVEIDRHDVECPKCSNRWTMETVKEHRAMKSNVDVYLASDMMVQASIADRPTRLILVSCDGDYAEAIKNAIRLNENISIAVLATPHVRDRAKNTLSVRLRELEPQVPRYILQDISSISDYVVANFARFSRGHK